MKDGKTGCQFLAPSDVYYDFKMACTSNRKSIREVILNFMYLYIKEHKGGRHESRPKAPR